MPSVNGDSFIFHSNLYSTQGSDQKKETNQKQNGDLLGFLFRTVFKDTMPYIVGLLKQKISK